ncbi:MAG: thioredoxin [Anaerolineales bacterium]|nr:thioredoxin [Anaerolineales bacterium]
MAFPTFSDDDFQANVLAAEGPVLVDFTAEWCGPCHRLKPEIEKLAGELGDRLTIGELNVDLSVRTAIAYGVMSIPTLILFKGGQAVARLNGFQPKDKIKAQLAPHL